MSERLEPVTEDQLQELLRQVQQGDERAREFAFMHVLACGDECQKVLAWQRAEGRAAVLTDGDPEDVRRQTEGRTSEARWTLQGKLLSLLGWAKGPGPGGGEGPASADGDRAVS
jgi:hypothetical protein